MKRMSRTMLYLGGLAFFGAMPLASEDNSASGFLDPGSIELSLNVTGSWSDPIGSGGFETTTVGGNAGVGVLLTSWLELGAKVEALWQKVEEDVSGDTPSSGQDIKSIDVFGGPVLILNFPMDSRVVPFVIGSVGAVYGKTETASDEDSHFGAYWDAGGGVRFFFTAYACVNVTVVFRQFLLADVQDTNNIVGAIGISLFF